MQTPYIPTPHNVFYFSPLKCNNNLYHESRMSQSSFSALQNVSAPQQIMYVISLKSIDDPIVGVKVGTIFL